MALAIGIHRHRVGQADNRFAYAPAIAVGACVAAVGGLVRETGAARLTRQGKGHDMARLRIFLVLVLALTAGGAFAFGTYRYIQQVPDRDEGD